MSNQKNRLKSQIYYDISPSLIVFQFVKVKSFFNYGWDDNPLIFCRISKSRLKNQTHKNYPQIIIEIKVLISLIVFNHNYNHETAITTTTRTKTDISSAQAQSIEQISKPLYSSQHYALYSICTFSVKTISFQLFVQGEWHVVLQYTN